MGRVALVTGGTRGIGAAISVALKESGCQVAANYGGNDEAAHRFSEETGIPSFKWDVGDFEACTKGIAAVAEALGPVDILVNNAGITRDTTLHRMTPEQWRAVVDTNLDSLFNMTRPVIEGMRERAIRAHRQHLLDQRPEGPVRPGQLLGRQGRRDRLHEGAGSGERGQGRHRQRAWRRATSGRRW